MRKSIHAALATALLFVALVAMPAARSQAVESNPLVAEMLLLNRAMRDIVSGVALGNTDMIIKAIESFEAQVAADKTRDALHSGRFKTPKNSDNLKEFDRIDREVHANLDGLKDAAQRKNRAKMLSFTKRILDGCVKCHETYRNN